MRKTEKEKNDFVVILLPERRCGKVSLMDYYEHNPNLDMQKITGRIVAFGKEL